ncbi:MAG: hypothetical protein PHH37_12640 [Paludibacter sp.]|nr:hypothetical protein [Paludibacter sp.]
MNTYLPLLLFTVFISNISISHAQTTPTIETIKEKLSSEYFEKLYSKTYFSLLDRLDSKGYLPESLTGAYSGMFPRTTGPYVFLLIETGRYQKAELTLKYLLETLEKNNLERIPRVIGGTFNIEDDQFQIDGQAHVILAWARLALKRGHTQFEDDTWEQVRALMKFTTSRAFFLHGHWYGHWSIEPGLVRNTAIEHSKESRMWDAFDLLTQSFVGAALTDMVTIAEKHQDKKMVKLWSNQLDLLKDGLDTNLTTTYYGIKTYLEMLLPNGDTGVSYPGLGWVTLSPVAAGWEGLDHSIMQNTVKIMHEKLLKQSNGVVWMPTDGYPDGTFSNEIIGKGIAWEIAFANSENDFNRLDEILNLIKTVNADNPIYMEGAWLDGDGYFQNKRLVNSDINQMTDCVWKVKDAGNGEQTAWWCWAIARLRKSVGLSAEPKRM